MDIKILAFTIEGPEQWNPLIKIEFTIKDEALINEVFPTFTVEMPALKPILFLMKNSLKWLTIIRI
ncbi:MAG: hypothetical protein CVT92_07155 [Bacteroidetes bacterium HGW-Bacteroidetes-1]|jgi:hypothetical protein|nr:MAG: hypothetical protein CVT92_07155 [Bacteroidetes bacterium HGW-Bacteroidetes-1]